MPDKIEQQLGFDASQALATLTELDAKFSSFGTQLSNVTTRMASFNASGASAVNSLRQVQSQAAATYASLSKLGSQKTNLDTLLGVGKTPEKIKEAHKAANLFLSTYRDSGRAAYVPIERANKSLDDMRSLTESVTLSWQTFARVIQTQALIRGFNLIRDSIKESTEAAIEFQRGVAEISAINPERTYGQIAANVRELSDAFNQPLDRTIEAQYQVISDQFVAAKDQLNILTNANIIAKLSNDDLSESAQTLTGALNAYGESSEMASLRAAQFFEAVNVGRFRMSELGTALGRTQAFGAELGITLEELQAALATITIGGVKANEAATQLRGVEAALLKPSEALKKALDELGVGSGKAAIATWGLQGTLETLFESVGRNENAMAKLFPNIRGTAGAFRLAASGAEIYAKNLERISAVDQRTLAKPFEAFKLTDAEKYTAELNKITNFFTTEAGTEWLASFNKIINAIGGADGLISVFRTLTIEMPKDILLFGSMALAAKAFAGTAGLVKTSLAGANGQLLLFSKNARLATTNFMSLRGALTTLLAVETARWAGVEIGQTIVNWIERPYKQADEFREQELRSIGEKTAAKIREEERLADERMKIIRQTTLDVQKEYILDSQSFQTQVDAKIKTAKRAFEQIETEWDKLTQRLTAEIEKILERAASIPDQIAKINAGIADRQFTRRVERFDEYHQAAEYLKRSAQLANEAARLQRTAVDDRQRELAQDMWDRAYAMQSAAESSASLTKNTTFQRKAEESLDALDKKRATSLKQNQKYLEKTAAPELTRRNNIALEHRNDLEERRVAIEKLLKDTSDDTGEVRQKSDARMQSDVEKAKKLITEYKEKLTEYAGEDWITTFLGDTRIFESLRRDAERLLAGVSISKIEATPDSIANLSRQLQSKLDEITLRVPIIAEMQTITGKSLREVGFSGLFEAYQEQSRALAGEDSRLYENIFNKTVEQERFDDFLSQFDSHLKKLADYSARYQRQIGGTGRQSYIGVDVENERVKIAQYVGGLERLRSASKITDDELTKLNQLFISIDWSRAFPGLSKTQTLQIGKDLEQMVNAVRRLQEIQRRPTTRGTAEERTRVNIINQQIDAIDRKNSKEDEAAQKLEQERNAALGGKTAIDSQFSSVNAGLASVSNLAARWWDVANAASAAASQAAMASTGPSGLTAALGGLIQHFDAGGSARGMDVIPAMLSEGEFVVNSTATRRWYAQLSAMNAGLTPTFRNQGGSVTNAGIVGDVTVNVSGNDGQKIGREVIAVLNRQIRRGSARLKV